MSCSLVTVNSGFGMALTALGISAELLCVKSG